MAKRKHPERRNLEPKNGQLDILNQYPIGAWKYPRIGVAILTERTLSHVSKAFWSFMGIAQQGPQLIKQPYMRTDMARNKAAMTMLQSNLTHILMLDFDHDHPTDIIQRLAKWVILDPNVWVVGGMNFRRGKPFEPCCFFKDDESGKVYAPAQWEQGLLRVDYIGTGCILIDRRVFEIIEPPWFAFDYTGVMADKWPGEDMWFSERCAEKGIDLWIDTTTSSPHMIDGSVTEATFRAYMEAMGTKTIPIGELMNKEKEPEQSEMA